MKTSKSEIIVKQIISKITKFNEDDLTDNILIREELGIDSIMAMEILVNIERTFDIKIDERKLQNVKTIKNLTDLIQGELSLKIKN